MKINYYIALFTLLLCIAGCEENRMMEYENSPAIYFSWSSTGNEQHDSINHSFFILNKEITQDTVWVKINTMGKTDQSDRPVAIVQTNAGQADAAIPGTHYLPFDSPGIKEKMVVPANKVQALIPIVLLRDISLDLKQIRLELAVANNEYFRPGIDKWRNFVITTTSLAVKPSNWDNSWAYYFGPTWGSVKMRFIIDATGYTEWEVFPSDNSYIQYMRNTVIQKFMEYNRDNPNDPLKEANDDLVVFM